MPREDRDRDCNFPATSQGTREASRKASGKEESSPRGCRGSMTLPKLLHILNF